MPLCQMPFDQIPFGPNAVVPPGAYPRVWRLKGAERYLCYCQSLSLAWINTLAYFNISTLRIRMLYSEGLRLVWDFQELTWHFLELFWHFQELVWYFNELVWHFQELPWHFQELPWQSQELFWHFQELSCHFQELVYLVTQIFKPCYKVFVGIIL